MIDIYFPASWTTSQCERWLMERTGSNWSHGEWGMSMKRAAWVASVSLKAMASMIP